MTTDLVLPVSYVRTHGLPRVCAVTGEPSDRTQRRVAYVRRPVIWLGLVIGLIGPIVLQQVLCDPLTVRVPHSREVGRRRTALQWIGLPFWLVGWFFVMWPMFEPSPVSVLAALAAVAGAVVPAVLRARTTINVSRDETTVRLRDVHPALARAATEHLASLTRPSAGWHPCPSGAAQYRWWDGARWTEHVSAYA